MLRLKSTLADAGIATGECAAAVGLSRPALSALLNNDYWPKTTPRARIEAAIRAFLQDRGVNAAGCFELEPDRELGGNDPAPGSPELSKGVDMLLRKQRLSQTAKEHFRLARDPFAQDPAEPDDVFMTKRLREIQADMESALLNGRFIAVSGESGSGKTTLRELVEEKLKNRSVKIIKPYVLGMEDNDKAGKTLRVAHIEEAIIRALDPSASVKRSSEARGHQVHELLKAANCPCAIVIEEAHALPIPTLKHFKRLRELKDGQRQLLGVLLIGQQELEDKLGTSKKEVREVMQRCEMVRLDPLGTDLGGYIAHRFARTGIVGADQVFEPGAIAAIGQALNDKVYQPVIQDGKKTAIEKKISLVYPLAVGNLAVAAMNLAAELASPKVTAATVERAMR